MPQHGVEEFGPLCRAAGVGHVAADKQEVERTKGMNSCEVLQEPIKALVAARTATSAFDTKTISLADHMKIRKMHDAPGACVERSNIEGGEIDRLIHAGVREAPGKRRHGEIARHQ